MANTKQISTGDATDNSKTKGTSILLRLPPHVADEIRKCAKREERTITTVMLRAIKMYMKSEYQIEIKDSE